MSDTVAFDTILRPTARREGELCFTITEDWMQGRSTFGGLQAAMALKAMRETTGVTAPLRVLQTSFIAPVGGGEVTVRASTLRAGKSVTHVEARLMQGADTLCLVVGIFGVARESAIVVPMAGANAAASPEGFKDLPFARGIAPNFTQHFQWRWAAGGWPYSGSVEPFTRIWLRHRTATGTGAAEAEYAMVALADAVPSPALPPSYAVPSLGQVRPAIAAETLAATPPAERRFPEPRLTPVAVLVSTLQDAAELWLQLPAGEYFELVNEIWLELDRIFTRHGGRHGRHPGEGMVCHFLPERLPHTSGGGHQSKPEGQEPHRLRIVHVEQAHCQPPRNRHRPLLACFLMSAGIRDGCATSMY